MQILYTPTVSEDKFYYTFNPEEEKIEVEFLGTKDVFDFSDFKEGEEYIDAETTLEINPLADVKREGGVLYITLRNFIDSDATEEERFPDWKVAENG